MSWPVPQVFISSTSEFAAERKQLQQALVSIPDFDFKPYIYEEDAAGPASPEKHLMRVLDKSEIVVLILGSTYGSEFPGRAMSIVEWEFEYAKEAAKELKGYYRETPPVHPRQATFVARARQFREGAWVRLFDNVSDLVSYVVADVKRWRLDSWQHHHDTAPARRKWKDKVVTPLYIAVILATLGGVIGGGLNGVPQETLKLFLVAGIAMSIGLGWFLKSKDI